MLEDAPAAPPMSVECSGCGMLTMVVLCELMVPGGMMTFSTGPLCRGSACTMSAFIDLARLRVRAVTCDWSPAAAPPAPAGHWLALGASWRVEFADGCGMADVPAPEGADPPPDGHGPPVPERAEAGRLVRDVSCGRGGLGLVWVGSEGVGDVDFVGVGMFVEQDTLGGAWGEVDVAWLM